MSRFSRAGGRRRHKFRRALALVVAAALITTVMPGALWSVAAAAEPVAVVKTFSQMTEAEKERVLDGFLADGTVPVSIGAGGGTYWLNEGLWYSEGIIAYGDTAAVNAAVQTTGSPNYKNGQYRYWGFDVNGGLYGNDRFPRDSDSGTDPWRKEWLTTDEIRMDGTARNYVGQFALNTTFSHTSRHETAEAFLAANPAWGAAGHTADTILAHFYFNAVVSDSGLTQGQFVGVHRSRYDGRLYYQTFSLSVEYRTFVVPPEEPAPEEPPADPGDGTPGDTGEPGDGTPPDPSPAIDATCSLGLPAYGYEGHPVPASDDSLYTVEGEVWSARRTMEEGLATNRFSLPAAGSGQMRRLSPTWAEAVFPEAGVYPVRLTIEPSGGTSLWDEKTVEIRATPAIEHTLTGVRKENRKQTIHMRIAVHPDHPIVAWTVEIARADTGEIVLLQHKQGAGENAGGTSETIRTRPIEPGADDDYFRLASLSFLTKNGEAADYRYTIRVTDDRGRSAEATALVPVAPDRPPEPSIEMAAFFLRGENSDRATIEAGDGTVTDGDQLKRSWYVQLPETMAGIGTGTESGGTVAYGPWIPAETIPDFGDRSFGTGRRVGFGKEGVGPFRVRLEVKDVWSEETLPEFVTEADRKGGAAEAEADVLNVAPEVRLTPIQRRAASVLLLGAGDGAVELLEGGRAALVRAFREAGYDAAIRTVPLQPVAERSGNQPAEPLMEVHTPFGYNGGSTFYESSNFLADDRRLYKIDATWTSAAQDTWPAPPWTITCFEAEGGAAVWTYTFGPKVLAVPDQGTYLAQDDEGVYLFLVAGGKTMILDKATGTFLAVVPFAAERGNYVGGQGIYTMRDDGIWRIDTGTGAVARVLAAVTPGASRRVEGEVHFLAVDGMKLYRGRFDPASEAVSFSPLSGNTSDDGRTSYRLLSADSTGRLLVEGLCPTDGGWRKTLRRYGADGRAGRVIVLDGTSAHTYTVAPVPDEAGRCDYAAVTWDSRSSTTYRVTARLYGLDSGYTGEATVTDSNGYPSESSQIIFARSIGGKIYVATGAYWTYILYTGSYGNGPTHGYPERTKVFRFDPTAGTAVPGTVDELGLGLVTREYGHASDTLAAVQTGNNHVGLTNGNETVVVSWRQTAQDVLERTLEKWLQTGRDRTLAVLLDGTPDRRFTDSDTNGLEERLRGRGAAFVRLTAAAPETGWEEELANGLADSAGARNTLAVEAGEGGGTLQRTMALAPDTTYYYEYEIKSAAEELEGSVSMTARTGSTMPAGAFGAGGYRVESAPSEDFNDLKAEPFFTLQEGRISDGWYKGGNVYNQQGSNWSNRYFQDISSLSFTVPEGRQGVLSFDWQLKMDGEHMWTANFVQVDGRAWQVLTPASGSGRYTHPALLAPGPHTVTFIARAYGGRITEARTWIDDLRVDLLVPLEGGTSPGAGAGTGVETGAGGESGGGAATGLFESRSGYRRVSGTFRTPPAVTAYRPLIGAEVFRGPIGAAPHTRWTSTEAGRRAFAYDVPAGKTAVYTLVHTASSPRIYNGNYYGSTYTHGPYSWTCYPGDRYPQSAMNNIPADYRIFVPGLAGTQAFSQNSASYRGAYGDFTHIESALLPAPDPVTAAGRYFLQGDGLYPEAEVFMGEGSLLLELPEGRHSIRDLAVYSLAGGVRSYALRGVPDAAGLADWQASGATAAVVPEPDPEAPETPALVYRKGETVSFAAAYSDFEGDPSKRSYYRYIHTPFNDGPHPSAAVILGEDGTVQAMEGRVMEVPIERFYIDGKYTLEHWQVDNTARPPTPDGRPAYDKASNVETMTFYITGSASAPWIESIRTAPVRVRPGQPFTLGVRIDDREKDELRLRTELYREGRLLFGAEVAGLVAGPDGAYPEAWFEGLPLPASGVYDVVCTVRDATGAGIGSYRFTVVSEGRVEGAVSHTARWEENRRAYNLRLFGTECDDTVTLASYLDQPPPRMRGTNVFYSGERFVLTAAAAGDPTAVTASIPALSGVFVPLADTGRRTAAGERIFDGELWDPAIGERWGRREPEEVVFRFAARYSDGSEAFHEAAVILDRAEGYWQLHRLW